MRTEREINCSKSRIKELNPKLITQNRNKSQIKQNLEKKTKTLLAQFILKLKEVKEKKNENDSKNRTKKNLNVSLYNAPSIQEFGKKNNKKPLNVNCLALISKLKKKQNIKNIIKKRHFRIKSILNGHNTEIESLNKDFSCLKCLLFEPEILQNKSGKIMSISFNTDINVLIGTFLFK